MIYGVYNMFNIRRSQLIVAFEMYSLTHITTYKMFLQGLLPWRFFDSAYHEYVGRALLGNVKQLAHQVTGNRAANCGNGGRADWREEQLSEKIRKIERHLDRGDVTEGIRESDAASVFAKEALLYFRQYQRTRFLTYLSIMWFSWITVLFLKLTGTRRQYRRIPLLLLTNIGFASLLIITLTGHIGSNVRCEYILYLEEETDLDEPNFCS